MIFERVIYDLLQLNGNFLNLSYTLVMDKFAIYYLRNLIEHICDNISYKSIPRAAMCMWRLRNITYIPDGKGLLE